MVSYHARSQGTRELIELTLSLAFVRGPYLVRDTSLESKTLSLKGDIKEAVEIEIWTYDSVNAIKWNGKRQRFRRTPAGRIKISLDDPIAYAAPTFGTWKTQVSLPERWMNSSDSSIAWANANHMSTSNPKNDATKPLLYGDDYGFHHGIKLWRGRFNGSASGMNIRTQGGVSHGWTMFFNGQFLDSYRGSLSRAYSSNGVIFSEDALREDGENIVLIVQDNAGHDQGSSAINPRGILNATLYDNTNGFTSWKVAGTAGGAIGVDIDPVQTAYSEGGLAAECLGWQLPGHDDSDWPGGSPSDGFGEAGVKFYRASLVHNTPEWHDVSLSVRLSFNSTETSTNFGAYLYINGHQYAKYFPYFAKDQNTFPVPPGI